MSGNGRLPPPPSQPAPRLADAQKPPVPRPLPPPKATTTTTTTTEGSIALKLPVPAPPYQSSTPAETKPEDAESNNSSRSSQYRVPPPPSKPLPVPGSKPLTLPTKPAPPANKPTLPPKPVDLAQGSGSNSATPEIARKPPVPVKPGVPSNPSGGSSNLSSSLPSSISNVQHLQAEPNQSTPGSPPKFPRQPPAAPKAHLPIALDRAVNSSTPPSSSMSITEPEPFQSSLRPVERLSSDDPKSSKPILPPSNNNFKSSNSKSNSSTTSAPPLVAPKALPKPQPSASKSGPPRIPEKPRTSTESANSIPFGDDSTSGSRSLPQELQTEITTFSTVALRSHKKQLPSPPKAGPKVSKIPPIPVSQPQTSPQRPRPPVISPPEESLGSTKPPPPPLKPAKYLVAEDDASSAPLKPLEKKSGPPLLPPKIILPHQGAPPTSTPNPLSLGTKALPPPPPPRPLAAQHQLSKSCDALDEIDDEAPSPLLNLSSRHMPQKSTSFDNSHGSVIDNTLTFEDVPTRYPRSQSVSDPSRRSIELREHGRSSNSVSVIMEENRPPSIALSISSRSYVTSFDELRELAKRMIVEVECKNRKHLLKKYTNCFTGKDAVSWILSNGLARSEQDAVAMGNTMLAYNMFVNAADADKKFEKNSSFATIPAFYRWMDERFWLDIPLDNTDTNSLAPSEFSAHTSPVYLLPVPLEQPSYTAPLPTPTIPTIITPQMHHQEPHTSDQTIQGRTEDMQPNNNARDIVFDSQNYVVNLPRRPSASSNLTTSTASANGGLGKGGGLGALVGMIGNLNLGSRSQKTSSSSEKEEEVVDTNGHLFSKSIFKDPRCIVCKTITIKKRPKMCKICGLTLHVKCAALDLPCAGFKVSKKLKKSSAEEDMQFSESFGEGQLDDDDDEDVEEEVWSSDSDLDEQPSTHSHVDNGWNPDAKNDLISEPARRLQLPPHKPRLTSPSNDHTSSTSPFIDENIYAEISEVTLRRNPGPEAPPSPSPSADRESTYENTDVIRAYPVRGGMGGSRLLHVPPVAPLFRGASADKFVSVTKAGFDDDDIYETVTYSSSGSKVEEDLQEFEGDEDRQDENDNEQEDHHRAPFSNSSRLASIKGIRLALSPVARIPPLPELLEEPTVSVPPVLVSPINSPFRERNRLWQTRPDVKESGLLTRLPKSEIKRQEAIFEVVYSEEAYLSDVRTLIQVYLLPLQAEARTAEFNHSPVLLDRAILQNILSRAQAVEKVGKEVYNALLKRQAVDLVVESIADIFLMHADDLLKVFQDYCEVSVEIKEVLERKSPALESFLKMLAQDERARGLPLDAYLLTPVQRVARYPLLLSAVLGATDPDAEDHNSMGTAQELMQSIVRTCNDHMRRVEDQLTMADLAIRLDQSRLEEPVTLNDGKRTLFKRGSLELITVANKKITKSKTVEFLLFTDIFLFAKPVEGKKGLRKLVVYKLSHRSLVEARDVGDIGGGNKEPITNVLELVFFGLNTTVILVRASSSTDKMRWMEAINPPRDEDIYAEWDCPQAKALYDYEARNNDELSLVAGEIINIVQRGADWSKGFRSTSGDEEGVTGWFPTNYVKEVASKHLEARVLKANYEAEKKKFLASPYANSSV